MSRYFDLDAKRALVTGGGTGLGAQFTSALVEAGAHVVICGRRLEPLEMTRDELQTRGLEVTVVVADVTKPEDLAMLQERVEPLDILINNAGYSIRTPWLEVTSDEWNQVMAVNLEAPFRLSQLFAPRMIERGWGRIVNVASVYGVQAGDPARYFDLGLDIASYFASKHGLLGITKHLAVVLAETGVTVNAISPGAFPPPDDLEIRPEALEAFAGAVPMKRCGGGDDLKSALLFLTSPASGYVTGQNVVVDGGWTIW